jgi:hypothetical protein
MMLLSKNLVKAQLACAQFIRALVPGVTSLEVKASWVYDDGEYVIARVTDITTRVGDITVCVSRNELNLDGSALILAAEDFINAWTGRKVPRAPEENTQRRLSYVVRRIYE